MSRDPIASRDLNRKIVLIAGELSGEIHALHLVEAMREFPPFQWSGIGSRLLAGAGVRIVYDYANISLTGLSEVFAKLKYIREAYRVLKHHLLKEKPALVILVDFPGFNLKVARMAKKMGVPVLYFIPPQIWAWRASRIKAIKAFVDRVICILPFEKELYDRHGVDAAYIGHPFSAIVKPRIERNEFLRIIGAGEGTKVVTVMPGSRENEVARHMPVIREVVGKLQERFQNLKVVLPLAESIDEGTVREGLEASGILVVRDMAHDALAYSDLAIIASGSATLEAAILGAPTIVIYKVSAISYRVAKAVVKVKHISLPNIIMGKEVFPEYIQNLSAEDIAEKASYMLKDGRKGLEKEMEEMRKRIGSYDSYRLAAQSVVQFLEGRYGALH